MRRITLTIVGLILILSLTEANHGQDPAGSQPVRMKDGIWWKELSSPTKKSMELSPEQLGQIRKVSIIEGYVMAMNYADVLCEMGLAAKEGRSLVIPANKRPYKENFDFNNITTGQFVEGINQFYSDFRNTRIPFYSALDYVRDQIKGVPSQQLELKLERMRQAAHNPQEDE